MSTPAERIAAAREARKRAGFVQRTVAIDHFGDEQRETISRAPQTMRKNLIMAFTGKSRGAAIRAKCLECSNWDRKEVRNCLIPGCPLWQYRPYRVNK